MTELIDFEDEALNNEEAKMGSLNHKPLMKSWIFGSLFKRYLGYVSTTDLAK
jgi:hypothetical protein